MDKNFVNIDNLVRQRLGGGEEQEQSGSWARMRELLDKEMPQEKRIGIMYWRRMFSALAILLLIGTISVGGYELSANRNGNGVAHNDVVVSPVSTNSINTSNNVNEITDNQLSASGAPENNTAVKSAKQENKNDNQKLLASNSTNNNQAKEYIKQTAATTEPSGSYESDNDNNELPVAEKNSNNKAYNNYESDNDNNELPVAEKNSNNKANNNHPVVAKMPVKKSGSREVAANNNEVSKTVTPARNDKHANKTATAHKSVMPATKYAHEGGNKDNVAMAVTTGKPANNNQTTNKKAAKARKVAKKEAVARKVHTQNVKMEKMEALALNSHAISPDNQHTPAFHKLPVQKLAAPKSENLGSKLAVNSHAVAKKTNITRVNTSKVIAQKHIVAVKKLSVKKDKKSVAKIAAVTSAPGKGKNANKTGNQPLSAVAQTHVKAPAGENAAIKQAYVLNTKKDKKVIQKLILYAHYINTAPDGHYNIDTISMKTLTEVLGLSGENSPLMPAEKKPAARNAASAPAAASGNNNAVAANENAEGSTAASANPQIMPGASASANGKPAMGQKVNSVSKQSSGAAALANLSATFNDIKNTASGVQFAAGLKGGVNGTFFGPSSFNGFQFGVTGDFIFGNDWSFATELEYFHRINNNYALADNYYSYTPINGGAGGYNKEQQQNLYSFSTLHSIEMPLIVKYSAGKFNLFVGGNLVYTFSINTGAAPQPSTGNITYAPIQGNDQQPKLDASDFNSRFGVGCLFGVSYKVAPNVTLDLRNVMTLWDNANSQGAKYVSDQLYKSPSVQLSLGYRLGGRKNKDQ